MIPAAASEMEDTSKPVKSVLVLGVPKHVLEVRLGRVLDRDLDLRVWRQLL